MASSIPLLKTFTLDPTSCMWDTIIFADFSPVDINMFLDVIYTGEVNYDLNVHKDFEKIFASVGLVSSAPAAIKTEVDRDCEESNGEDGITFLNDLSLIHI